MVSKDVMQFESEMEVTIGIVVSKSLVVDGEEGRVLVHVDVTIAGLGIIQRNVDGDSYVDSRSILKPTGEGSSAVDGFGGEREGGFEGGFAGNCIEIGVEESSLFGILVFKVWMAVG